MAVTASGAQIVESFTISVSGEADQNFLRTPFDCASERLPSWPGLVQDKPGHDAFFRRRRSFSNSAFRAPDS